LLKFANRKTLTGFKKTILLILTVWLAIVSMNIYRFTSVATVYISVDELGKKYFEENTIHEFNLYEPKLASTDLIKNSNADFRIVIQPEWIKSILTKVSDVSYYTFSSYKTEISNEDVFKDFRRIYPFHFFF